MVVTQASHFSLKTCLVGTKKHVRTHSPPLSFRIKDNMIKLRCSRKTICIWIKAVPSRIWILPVLQGQRGELEDCWWCSLEVSSWSTVVIHACFFSTLCKTHLFSESLFLKNLDREFVESVKRLRIARKNEPLLPYSPAFSWIVLLPSRLFRHFFELPCLLCMRQKGVVNF